MTIAPVHIIGSTVQKEGSYEDRHSQPTLSKLAHGIMEAMKEDAVNVREWQGALSDGKWFGDSAGVVCCALSRGLIDRGDSEKWLPLNLPKPEGIDATSWKKVPAVFVYEEDSAPEPLTALFEQAKKKAVEHGSESVKLYDLGEIHETAYIAVSTQLEAVVGKTASAVHKYIIGQKVNTL